MRPDRIVLHSPSFYQNLRFQQGTEDFPIKKFVPQFAVKALNMTRPAF